MARLLRFDGRRFFVDHVPQGEPVAVDDDMVTSGLGGTVPRGLPVGRVVAVSSSQSELFQQIEVESPVDYSALRDVYVVVRPGPWYAHGASFSITPMDTTSGDDAGPTPREGTGR